MKLISLVGEKYGKLTVLKRHDQNDKRNRPLWVCQCDCGKTAIVGGYNLRSGNTKSCGCLQIEFAKQNGMTAKHGMRNSRMYNIWHGMKQRCSNPNHKDFPNYGGRGITVCDEWKNDFLKFYDWAISNGYSDDLTIDRIDMFGNYKPSNCRWIPKPDQNKNKRNVRILEYNGQSKSLTEWSKETGISISALSERLKRGWSIEDTLTKPARNNGH